MGHSQLTNKLLESGTFRSSDPTQESYGFKVEELIRDMQHSSMLDRPLPSKITLTAPSLAFLVFQPHRGEGRGRGAHTQSMQGKEKVEGASPGEQKLSLILYWNS